MIKKPSISTETKARVTTQFAGKIPDTQKDNGR